MEFIHECLWYLKQCFDSYEKPFRLESSHSSLSDLFNWNSTNAFFRVIGFYNQLLVLSRTIQLILGAEGSGGGKVFLVKCTFGRQTGGKDGGGGGIGGENHHLLFGSFPISRKNSRMDLFSTPKWENETIFRVFEPMCRVSEDSASRWHFQDKAFT